MTEELSRTSRKHKKKKSKKPFVLSFFLVLLLIASGTLYWFIQKEGNQKAFNEKQSALEKTIQEEMKETGMALTQTKEETAKFQKFFYFPSEDNEFNQQLKKQVKDLMAKEEQKVKDEKGTLVGNISVHHITDQLSSIQPKVTSYLWNSKKETFDKKEMTPKEVLYLNQSTQQPLTAKDLFPEEADLLGLYGVIQQKILDESKDGTKIIDDVLNFPKLSFENLKFVYEPEKLTITLPKNNLNVESMSLNLDEIGEFMNPAFVDPTKVENKQLAFDPNKKYITITFDDGPGPETTMQLLQTLKEKGVKTTFFNLGENATEYPDVVKQIVADGHEIANHSFTHPALTDLSIEDVEKEIKDTNKAIYLATGKLPHKVRPPYGAIAKDSANAAGAPIIQWNIDSNDWGLKDAKLIEDNVVNNAFNGGIILLHDIHQFSVDAVPNIIDRLKNEGYEFITLDEMLGITKPLYQYFGLYQGKTDDRIVE